MTEWRMYGTMFPEKLRPLIDKLHNPALAEYERKRLENQQRVLEGGIEEPLKIPQRVTAWGIVAREEYEKEPEDVKKQVAAAVKAAADNDDKPKIET
jgi:hypothetical protein